MNLSGNFHKKYKALSHTADLGIQAYGRTQKELFENAAFGMFELIADLSKVGKLEIFTINISADDADLLLKDWLSELLYYFNVKHILLSEFNIENIDEKNIISQAAGEKIDLKKHDLRHEIKAATYHHLHIEQKDRLFVTDIIFDV